eukprot:5342296-Amphidinium_carterae.3
MHGISLGPTWALHGCFRPLLENEPGWKWLQQNKYEHATVMTLMGETESNTSMHRLGCSPIQLIARQLELQQL